MTFEDEPMSPELRALLGAEKARPAVPSEVSARLAHKLASSLSLSPEALSSAEATPGSGAASLATNAASQVGASQVAASSSSTLLALSTSSRLWPLLLTFALGSATGATMTAAWMTREREAEATAAPATTSARDAAPQAHVMAPVPTQALPEAPAEAPPHELESEPLRPLDTQRPATAASHGDHAARDEDRGLGAEQRLLEQARAALARGLARDALVALDRHKARFPRGVLREERESLRVPVLVALGRHDEARNAAARFLARYPSSIFAPSVERALASIP